jgi:hypothetical protein
MQPTVIRFRQGYSAINRPPLQNPPLELERKLHLMAGFSALF